MSRRPKTSREQVLTVLRKRDGRTPIEIADATGLEHDNVRQLLRRMARASEITPRHGSYFLPARDDYAREENSHHVVGAVSACLKRLERENFDRLVIGQAALNEAIDFMARTLGTAMARTQFQKVGANLDKVLADLEEQYWSKE